MRRTAKKAATVIELASPERRVGRVSGHVVGRLVDASNASSQGARVDYPGNPHGPLACRSLLEPAAVLLAHAQRQDVLLVFENERSNQPIIVGILATGSKAPAAVAAMTSVQPAEASSRPELVELTSGAEAATAQVASPDAGSLEAPVPKAPLEAVVDGRRVVFEAQDEIVLRCGEASITLRRNGRIVVRGAYVETRARGVVRIKGGSVQVN